MALSEDAAIQQACEVAIQDGRYGVLVTRDADGRLVSAEPHPDVPYGVITESSAAGA